MVVRQRASSARIQARARVVLETSRRSVVAEDPSVSDSALRRQQAEARISVALRNRNRNNLQLASQSRRLPARLKVKRVARKKEGKARMVNPADRHLQEKADPLLANHHQEGERQPLAHQPEVERRLRQPSALRDSQSAARRSLKKNHHRQDRNNSGVISDSGSGRKIPEPLFLVGTPRCGIRTAQRAVPTYDELH
jgi:hypothetical protein